MNKHQSIDHPRIAIVHYHLRRGGVTRVIETACQALTAAGVPVVVLSGAPPEATFEAAPVRVVSALGYHQSSDPKLPGVRDLIRQTSAAAAEALGGKPDLWHIHNAPLGKNPVVTQMVGALAADGVAVLSQIHDFAEDQRPGNWRLLVDTLGNGDPDRLDEWLYPVGSHVNIAVLNDRDRQILLQAGAPESAIVLLPNPVTAPVDAPSPNDHPVNDDDSRLWLYPTRAIRRKNLGEFILWSAMAEADDRFATTLTPTNPRDCAVYETWVKLANANHLPIRFGVGLDGETAFRGIMHRATALATTSIAEGFGLAYLEPWLLNKPIVGRRLPDITADMESAGVDLSGLYDRLDIPLTWVGRDQLRHSLAEGLAELFDHYDLAPPHDAAERAMNGLVTGDTIDFGGLNETMQRSIVERIAGSPADAKSLHPHKLAETPATESVIAKNRQQVMETYSPEAYGRRLQDLYGRLLAKRDSLNYLPASAVLTQFLQPERFRLLRADSI